VKTFEELALTQTLFSLIADTCETIDTKVCNEHTVLFNKWSYRTLGGTSRGMINMNYYDRGLYGMVVNVDAFMGWMWEELKLLEEHCKGTDWSFSKLLTKIKELIKVRQIFALWDFDKSNFLEMHELRDVIASYRGHNRSDSTYADPAAVLDGFMQKYDTHGEIQAKPDGKINIKEFAIWVFDEASGTQQFEAWHTKIEELVRGQMVLEQIVQLFEKWDLAQTGTIERPKLHSVMCEIHDFAPGQLDALIDKVDPEKTGNIDYRMFVRSVIRPPLV